MKAFQSLWIQIYYFFFSKNFIDLAVTNLLFLIDSIKPEYKGKTSVHRYHKGINVPILEFHKECDQ